MLQDHDGNTPLHVACEQGLGECATEMTRDFTPSKLSPVLETQNWRGGCHLGCVLTVWKCIVEIYKGISSCPVVVVSIQKGTNSQLFHQLNKLSDSY